MPCYAADNIVENALASIAKQTKKDYIRIIMVNDCSPHTNDEYLNVRDKFKHLDILYLKTQINSGPAVARNLALKNVTAPYIMFHDDDDILQNNFVIEQFLQIINQNDNICSIAGGILTEYKDNLTQFTPARNNDSHFGKIFNSAFIKNNNINFDEELGYYEEDAYFLVKYYLYSQNQKHFFLKDNGCCYVRQMLPDYKSLTQRTNMKILQQRSFIILLSKKIDLIGKNTSYFAQDLYSQIFIFIPYLFDVLVQMNKIEYLSELYLHLLKIIDYFNFGLKYLEPPSNDFINMIENPNCKKSNWDKFFKQFEEVYFN